MPEFYQGRNPNHYYVVPAGQRKIERSRVREIAQKAPDSFEVVPNPWKNYDREWDWIETDDGLCLNYAGCLDREEIDRKEDEGVARALEYVAALVNRLDPVPVSLKMIRQVHRELMSSIYPFAGEWRTVSLHKGEGPTKWPLPNGGIDPQMAVIERDILTRTPFLSDEDEGVYLFTSELMNEILAVHPFREGNGRTAFILGNLILMQNDMLPLDIYDRRRDEARYFDACEAARLHQDYGPLAQLIAEWEAQALERWEAEHGA
jgi:cell filamentation protein